MSNRRNSAGYLLLDDGARFEGEELFGSTDGLGEAVFNTSHAGYQEILTDPSYCRQIMVFTTPHIGNVGTNLTDMESSRIHCAGVVVRSLSPRPSNWRSREDLITCLERAGTPLLSGANTRAITLHLRTAGAMRAGLFSAQVPADEALARVKTSPSMEGADLAREVMCAQTSSFKLQRLPGHDPCWHPPFAGGGDFTPRVAVLDFGVKANILRELSMRGCDVIVVPGSTPAQDLLQGDFHGFLASNGPGDPAAVTYGVETIQALLEAGRPLMGICLGHQLMALAAGAETYKLCFGHRGANHPVRREADKVVEITSQNHGFAVQPGSLGADWRVTHINLNDGTVEGLEHRRLPQFSIQYHPEASPGPHEGHAYFDRFVEDLCRAQER